MPALGKLGNGDDELSVRQGELLPAQVLGDILYRSLVHKVEIGFKFGLPSPGPLFQELQQCHLFGHPAGTRSIFLFLHFG